MRDCCFMPNRRRTLLLISEMSVGRPAGRWRGVRVNLTEFEYGGACLRALVRPKNSFRWSIPKDGLMTFLSTLAAVQLFTPATTARKSGMGTSAT